MSGLLVAFAAVAASVSSPADCALARDASARLVCVSDDDLATMRGGVALPGGLDVSIAVRTETNLNGALLLRSVYTIDTGAPRFQVFAPAVGQSVAATPAAPANTANVADRSNIWVTYDRFNGVSVNSMAAKVPTTVTITSVGAAAPASATDTLPALNLSQGVVDAAGGKVSLGTLPSGEIARIVGDQIDVRHFVGQAFGSFIANGGNDRAIDTTTTISLDLRGATPENIGSALLRVESIALDAVRQSLSR